MKSASLLSILVTSAAFAAPEAFEVGPGQKGQLPRGKEADGIIGDFILRNDKVEAVVSGNLPLRRANLMTFYSDAGITPGNLYDLTIRGANNDQITCFQPAGQQGPVSWVRVEKDGSDGEAVVACMSTAPNHGGLMRRHEYVLRDGWQGVMVKTTLTNETKVPKKVLLGDKWTTFWRTGTAATGGAGILWAEAVDPADRCGYAVGYLTAPADIGEAKLRELKPGESVSVSRFLAVAGSPIEAVGIVAAQQGSTGRISGSVKDSAGAPVAGVQLVVRGSADGAEKVEATGPARVAARTSRAMGIGYTDAKGLFSFALPAGKYGVSFAATGSAEVARGVDLKAGDSTKLDVSIPVASSVVFEIRDESGQSIPCKAQFLAKDGTEPVNLGPDQRAHGCRDQYHSERGDFRVRIPPGAYRIVVTRGIEYSHLAQDVTLKEGGSFVFKGVLKRLVDTRGWVSADYHNHSTESGDNTCGTDDRIINLAAEGIEFAPTTEHNRLYDWSPHIERLGLSKFLKTVPGVELTGNAAHLNAFPFKPVPFTQDNGAPVWNKDPRIAAITLRDWQGAEPDRWIQINHPDMTVNFIDANGDGEPDGGFLGLATLIDGVETQNYRGSELLGGTPLRILRDPRTGKESVSPVREFIWLQLLNRGHRYAAVAACDAHTVWGNGAGGWRMYMPATSDEPAEIDWRENSRAAKTGRSYLTTGPFLQVRTGDGTGPGGETRAVDGGVKLHVRVQCTDWIDIDRVAVLVNGRVAKNLTRASDAAKFKAGVVKFDETLEVKLSEDAHIIVVACAETSDLSIGYGTSSQRKIRPFAYHNPIFVDVNGGGFTPNGDTLGWPLTTGKISLDDAKKMLIERGLDAKPPEPETSL